MGTFIKLKRSEAANDLLECHPNAFLLLSVIALRARRTPNMIKNLDVCECHVGDYKACGLTEQKYRTAKKVLEELGLATFHPTNKGTIAKIVNSDIYDINVCNGNEQDNDQATNGQRTVNDQVTTNKKEKKEKKEKTISPEIKNFTVEFQKYILAEKGKQAPEITDSLIKKGCDTIDKLIRLDGFTFDHIRNALRWAVKDDFWSNQVRSLAALRTKQPNGCTKFQNLLVKYEAGQGNGGNQNHPANNEITMESIEEILN